MHNHYKFFETVLNGKEAPIDIQAIILLAPTAICGCATCKEIMDLAARDAKEMIKTQCAASILQYAEFLKAIARTTIASQAHENNDYANAHDILTLAHATGSDISDQTQMVGIKYTEEIYNVGEELALAYLKRTS